MKTPRKTHATHHDPGTAAPNPCVPWPVPGVDVPQPSEPCGCKKSVPGQPPRTQPPESVEKKQDCCAQILEILRRMPGGADIKVHKPKQSTKVETANLCGGFPGVRSSTVPILMLFLRRFLDGAVPVNQAEDDIQGFLGTLPAEQMNALKTALDAYEKLPHTLRGCLFETRLEGCDNPDVLDPHFLLKLILNEAVHLGRATVFSRPGGALGPGKVRPWERSFPKPADQTGPTPQVTAPWPWICQVNPGADDGKWYKNRDVTVPGNVPLSAFTFEDHEFRHVCDRIPDPNQANQFIFNCHRGAPVASPGMFVPDCNDHPRCNYPWTTGTLCLTVPLAVPGQDIALRGLNFSSPNCKVRMRFLGSGFQELLLACDVMGDPDVPDVRHGQVVATCEVRDIIIFHVPASVRVGFNDVPLPVGRWSVEVIVPNDTAYAPTPGPAPAEFISNDIWLDLQPPPDQEFRVFTNEAFCFEETDGLGSDEPWFQAFTVKFVPAGNGIITMLPQTQFTIMNTDDVDSGEPITFNSPDIFRGRFAPGEVLAVTILGLEVDDEDAAKDQVRTFGRR